MKILEYFNTQKGQIYLRQKRRWSRLHFLIDQEPKSKSGISTSEKIHFQDEVFKDLNQRKKRAYRSPVIVEIDFHSNQDNPPSIHSLAKNYLDLLEDPIPQSKIKRKKLVYKDDRLIKILIVNYHVGQPSLGSHISITVDTLSNFINDLELIDRIKKNDFKGDDDHFWSLSRDFSHSNTNQFDDYEDDYFDNPITQLRQLERNRTSNIEVFGRETYEIQRDYLIKEVQKRYLKMSELKIDQLLMLFSTFLNRRESSQFFRLSDSLDVQNRRLLISPPFTLDLAHAPHQKGEKSIFKSNVKRVLSSFKTKYPILFPLRNPIGVTVLYVPPKNHNIDLDNLARYIIPFVNDILMPPSTFLNTIDISRMKNSDIKKRVLDDMKKIPKIPKYSITNYQFIELPRFHGDPDEGCVRLILGDGLFYDSLWRKIDNIIEKWESYID